MLRRSIQPLVGLLSLLLAVACQRENPSPLSVAKPTSPPATATGQTTRAGLLNDVVERDPRYMIGISYPPIASKYPNLGAELKRYADAARGELMQAVVGMGPNKSAAPYDLSLSFTEVAATPELVVIAADGSSYTGGAHSSPLVARFVWLPRLDKSLPVTELVPDPKAWRDIAGYIREQLHAALAQRVDADDLPPADRTEIVKNASRMIDEGTDPDVANFAQFEPVLTPEGRITALRFVFPPYQVGPYADGTQTVDVPADVLLSKIAPGYRHLFVGVGGRGEEPR